MPNTHQGNAIGRKPPSLLAYPTRIFAKSLTWAERSKIAADYDKVFASFLGEINNELQNHVDFIGIKKGGRLLDYACGTGFVSNVCDTSTAHSCYIFHRLV